MSEEIILTNVETADVTIRKSELKDLSKMKISEDLKELNDKFNLGQVDSHLKKIYEEMKKKNPNAKCPSCGGKPDKGKTCAICGSSVHKVSDMTKLDDTPIETTEKFFIPEKYRKEKFNSEKLLASHPDLKDSVKFQKYVKLLDAILGRINARQREKASLFISAPSGFGKETFAYTALQLALANDLTIFPYLDLMEVNRLITAYENANMRDPIVKEIGFSDVDLYTADICILKVPHNNVSMNNYKVLLQVIDRRARRGLATILLSRYNFKYFTALDSFKETQGIISYNNPSPKNLQVFDDFIGK